MCRNFTPKMDFIPITIFKYLLFAYRDYEKDIKIGASLLKLYREINDDY